jgi:hypothetical protein
MTLPVPRAPRSVFERILFRPRRLSSARALFLLGGGKWTEMERGGVYGVSSFISLPDENARQ